MAQVGMHGPLFVAHVRYLGFGGPIIATSAEEEGQTFLREAGASEAVMKGPDFGTRLPAKLEEVGVRANAVILVLEDDAALTGLIRAVLEEAEVLAASSVAEARRIFRERGSAIHAMLVDGNVPLG